MGTATGRPVVALMTGIAEYQLGIVAGIAESLDRRGVPLLAIANEPFGSDDTPSLVLDLIRRGVPRGVISLADSQVRGRELPAALARGHVPTVTVGIRLEGCPRVQGDNEGGMLQLMAHLLDDCGVRRPVLVRGVPHQVDSATRERVFRAELGRRGLDVDEGLVLDGEFGQQAAYDVVRGLLHRRTDLDAVVALNDLSGFGALCAVVDHGLRVPHDVLVTGFDGTEGSLLSWPALTTVDQDLAEQGRRAVELLLDLVDGADRQDDVLVPARLVVRASTAATGTGLLDPGVLDPADPEHLATLPGVRWLDGEPVVPLRELTDRMAEVTAATRTLQRRVALQSAALSLSWTMANCRTLDDVIAALDPCLGRVGVHRCFLAVDHVAVPGVDATDHPTRLVLSYRDGGAEDPSGEVFARHELLPPSLRAELDRGVLLLQALSIAGRERGYLLYEPVAESSLLTEALRIDLPRTVDTVLASQELQSRAAMLERLVARRTTQLEQANLELQRSVMRDGLTGIANRMAFQQYLDRMSSPDAEGRRLAVLMIDVDLFKAYNDYYGHLAGDDALRSVGDCLLRCTRGHRALACRYGGEEFAVVLEDGALPEATAVARRLRELLSRAATPHAASTVADVVTVSIGVAAGQLRAGVRATDLVADADGALYRAKLQGRDRVVTARRRRDRDDRKLVGHP